MNSSHLVIKNYITKFIDMLWYSHSGAAKQKDNLIIA